jgi:2-amino-4-hydroxy-6-hydroxymethyldihydropteridine diphosphokinase
MHTLLLGLGSNLRDRLANLQAAVDLLALEGIHTTACSRVWETEPVGGPQGQPEYLNAVIVTGTDLDPVAALAAAHRVEDRLGRVRDVRWGPRTIDVDLLLYDGVERSDPTLILPHPRIAERAFVLLPLLDVDPDPRLPGGERLLEVPFRGAGARPFAPPLRLPQP